MTALYPVYIFAILALEVLVALLIYIWWKTLKTQQTQLEYASRDTYQELAKIVKATSEEAKKVLAKAFQTVSQLEKDTQAETDKFRQRTGALWDAEGEWQTKNHQEILEQYHKIIATETAKVIKDLGQSLTKDMTLLHDELADTIESTRAEVRQEISTKIKAAEAEIEKYQQSEVERIHGLAENIVKDVSAEMFQRTLTPTDQHQLVLKQLQQSAGTFKDQDE